MVWSVSGMGNQAFEGNVASGVPHSQYLAHMAFRLQHGARAGGTSAAASPYFFKAYGMPYIEADAIVVTEFLARFHIAQRFNDHAVLAVVAAMFMQVGNTVGYATVVEPSGIVAIYVAINNPPIVQCKKEGVPRFHFVWVPMIGLAGCY